MTIHFTHADDKGDSIELLPSVDKSDTLVAWSNEAGTSTAIRLDPAAQRRLLDSLATHLGLRVFDLSRPDDVVVSVDYEKEAAAERRDATFRAALTGLLAKGGGFYSGYTSKDDAATVRRAWALADEAERQRGHP